MPSHPREKYVMFRNFMANELGITREDIEAWTKEAIQREVQKKVGQIDIRGFLERTAIRREVEVRNMLVPEMAEAIARTLRVVQVASVEGDEARPGA